VAASVPSRRLEPLPAAPSLAARFHAWAPAVAWAMLIFVMSTDKLSAEHTRIWIEPVVRFVLPRLTAHAFALVHTSLRKLAHVSEYAVFAWLLDRALRLDSPVAAARAPIVGLGIAMAYSFTDEGHQWFVASRGASWVDCMVDTLGAAIGAEIARRRRPVQ
jgi:VanZ family protein